MMRTTNFTKHEFQCHQSIFLIQTTYWHFLVYFDLNLKLLDLKITQTVNKPKISCKKQGFVLVVRMSRTR